MNRKELFEKLFIDPWYENAREHVKRLRKAYYDYLTYPWGWEILFWDDGDISFRQYNESFSPEIEKRILVCRKCPGFGNIDTSPYEEGFIWDEEKEVWIDETEGTEIGKDISDVIYYLAVEGFLDEEIEEWIEKMKEEIREEKKQRKHLTNRRNI